MKADYIKPFIKSAIYILKAATGLKARKKRVYFNKGKMSLGGTGIILGIHGDIRGTVAYEFSRDMTIQLASRMNKKSQIVQHDREAFLRLLKSTVGELGNLISGRAITALMENGYDCKITPPEVYTGQGVPLIHSTKQTFVIELQSELGDFYINLAISHIRP